MKNNEFFELNCTINNNHQNKLTLKIPMEVHNEFEQAISNRNSEAMKKLAEIFSELSDFDLTMQMTFQALIENNAEKVHSFNDLLMLIRTVRLCAATDKWSNGGGI